MNQVITIKWWHPDCLSEVIESAKIELNDKATAHIRHMIEQGFSSGDLRCEFNNVNYQGWWELYSSDRNNLSRKIYDEIDGECITETDTVKMSQVQKVLEKYLGNVSL